MCGIGMQYIMQLLLDNLFQAHKLCLIHMEIDEEKDALCIIM